MSISSLVLTDGATTATLTDGINYALTSGGWAPSVARRRTAELGGVGPYAEVEEQIQLDIFSTPRTLATTLANVAKLQTLCDQARRWSAGENVTAVRLQLTMTGSTMKEAAILDGALDLPSDFADLVVVQEVGAATLRLTRRGLWVAAAVTSAASSAFTGPTPVSVTLASHPTPSPLAITIKDIASSFSPAVANVPSGYLVVASDTNAVALIEGESLVFGTSSTVGNATASGANILRASTSPAAGDYGFIALTSGFYTGARQIAIFAALRVNGSATRWQVSAELTYETQLGVVAAPSVFRGPIQTPRYTASTDAGTVPRIVFLGLLSVARDPRFVRINWLRTTGTGSIDLDYLLLVNVKNESVAILGLSQFDGNIKGGNGWLTVDSLYTQSPSPLVLAAFDPLSSTVAWPATYTGNATLMHTGTTVRIAALLRDTNNGNWTFTTSAGAKQSLTFVATRQPAYLTPE